jgi:hypothetical protein
MLSLRHVCAAVAALLLLGAAPAKYPVHPVTSPDIKAADIAARDKAISDDVFEGRGPGTVNGEAAAQWIADELKRIGIKPANHGSYFQNMTAAVIALDAAKSTFAFATPKPSPIGRPITPATPST